MLYNKVTNDDFELKNYAKYSYWRPFYGVYIVGV